MEYHDVIKKKDNVELNQHCYVGSDQVTFSLSGDSPIEMDGLLILRLLRNGRNYVTTLLATFLQNAGYWILNNTYNKPLLT